MATIRAIMQSTTRFVRPPAWTNQGHYPQPASANYTPPAQTIDGPDQSENKLTGRITHTIKRTLYLPPSMVCLNHDGAAAGHTKHRDGRTWKRLIHKKRLIIMYCGLTGRKYVIKRIFIDASFPHSKPSEENLL